MNNKTAMRSNLGFVFEKGEHFRESYSGYSTRK